MHGPINIRLFNFVLDCAIRMLQVNQDTLNLDGLLQLLVYADDVTKLGRSVHALEKNAETSVVASKETELEANADETNYMVMSRDQNAGRSHDI